MTENFLLDTCFIIELLKGRTGAIEWLKAHENDNLAISGWTVLELMKEKKSKSEMIQTIEYLQKYPVYWPLPDFCDEIPSLIIDEFHGTRGSDGKLQGTVIFDALIASTAKSYSLTLVTMDSDFNKIKDLNVELLKST